MIIAIGIDIVEIARIEESFERQGERFRARVFTPAEVEYCEQRPSRFASYAARFAAKEAVMKALGTGWAGGLGWCDIEVACGEKGSPTILLHGRALERFNELGARRVHVSLTHARDFAAAQAILEA